MTCSSERSPHGIKVFEAASADQRDQLYKLRYRIFTQEQHKYAGAADHTRGMLVDELDEHAVHLCSSIGGQVVGSIRQVRGRRHATASMTRDLSLDQFSHYADDAFSFTGRLLILPEHRGSAALLKLLRAIYEGARQAGVVFDFIFCNPHLVKLYEQLGYRRYRKYFHDPGLGFQIPLVLVIDDLEHLQRIRSPFASLAKHWPADATHASWFKRQFPAYESFVTPAAMPVEEFSKLLDQKINNNDIPLFNELSDAEIEEFLDSSTHFNLDAGTHLVRRGDLGQEMYVILEGVAEIRGPRRGDQDGLLLATLGRGDVFGDMSVISTKPRSTDVFAATPLEVIFIDQITLRRFIKGRPEMAARLLHSLAKILIERIEMLNSRLIAGYQAGENSNPLI